MHRPKRWNIIEPHPDAEALAERLRTSPLLAQMLLNRGMAEVQECMDFLSPKLTHLYPPNDLPGVPEASQRVARAIREGQKIVVYGDYDVDGITATSILWHAIRQLGGNVDYYIPHRIEEGYGLNSDAIRSICDEGAGLIITVDCGITATEQAEVARERGVDMIITDHHEFKIADGPIADLEDEAPQSKIENRKSKIATPLLPNATVIVHPRLPGHTPEYPNPHLCGAGVAFK